MLSATTTRTFASTAHNSTRTKRCNVISHAQQAGESSLARRSLLSLGVLSLTAAAVHDAQARDFKEALARKEARKAKLKGSASAMKESGKDQQIFKSSDYMVSEDARTPNVHSRQGEGAKTQQNI